MGILTNPKEMFQSMEKVRKLATKILPGHDPPYGKFTTRNGGKLYFIIHSRSSHKGVKLTGGEGSLISASLGAIVLITLTNALIVIEMPNGARELIQGLILLVLLVFYTRAPQLRQ